MDDLAAAMFREVYQRALDECGYRATYFLQMLTDSGGETTALNLIRAPRPSDGFTALWERRRLDLTVEAFILREPWRRMFQEADLVRARNRLAQYGFDVKTMRYSASD
jgi:hypothetical protein